MKELKIICFGSFLIIASSVFLEMVVRQEDSRMKQHKGKYKEEIIRTKEKTPSHASSYANVALRPVLIL